MSFGPEDLHIEARVRVSVRDRERARCLAWLEWWESRGCRWSEYGAMGRGIESGQRPEGQGDEPSG